MSVFFSRNKLKITIIISQILHVNIESTYHSQQVSVGTSEVPINPSDNQPPSKAPTVSISNESFSLNNGHVAKTYMLLLRVYCVTNNGCLMQNCDVEGNFWLIDTIACSTFSFQWYQSTDLIPFTRWFSTTPRRYRKHSPGKIHEICYYLNNCNFLILKSICIWSLHPVELKNLAPSTLDTTKMADKIIKYSGCRRKFPASQCP